MNAIPLIVALLLGSNRAAVPVSVNLQPNEVISGTREIRVSVGEIKGLVQQVEFYLNGDLRETVSGYPYIFKLNSLDLDDGDATMDFEVQTTQGEKGKASVQVKIDNGVDKGAEFHVKHGLELLTDSKFAEAELAGRIAMKAARKKQDAGGDFDEKRDMNPARVVLARAYLGLARYDRAQKFAEDALAADPQNESLINLVSGVNLKKALRMVDRDGNIDQARDRVKTALVAAVDRQKQLYQERLDKFGQPTAENAIVFSDLAFKAGRFSQAIKALTPPVRNNPDRVDLANRLAYAQIKAERYEDARTTLRALRRMGHMNAYSYSLSAILNALAGQKDGVDADLKEAILGGGDELGVQLAQAYLAVAAAKQDVLGQILNKVHKDYPESPEVNVYLSDYMARSGRVTEARSYFEDAVLANPLLDDAFLHEARMSLIAANIPKLAEEQKTFRLKTARMYYDVALAIRPESAEAMLGEAFCLLQTGDPKGALNMAQAASAAAPSYAAAPYAAAAFCRANSMVDDASKYSSVANKLDKANLEGKDVPKTMDALRYFVRYGASPIITAP